MPQKLGMKELTVAGAKIKVLEGGQGPDMLFLHGAEGPETYSSAYLDELAKSYRVIAPWHPGFGHSERPKGFTKIDDLAYFYLDLAEHYGSEQCRARGRVVRRLDRDGNGGALDGALLAPRAVGAAWLQGGRPRDARHLRSLSGRSGGLAAIFPR